MSVFVEAAPDPLNQEPFEWDSAAIGSSPVSVVNAILENFQGRKVVVLEARDVVGGAWAGDTVCGVSGIDIGSHDHCFDKERSEFLEKFFGISFIESCPGGYLPKGGCAKMSEKLVQIAKNAGVTVKTGCKVEKATLIDQGVLLDCRDIASGQLLQMTTKKVIKPSYVAFDVYRGPDQISQPIKTVRKQHLYFIVNDGSASKEYLLQEILMSSIFRIANLTLFVTLESSDHRMFVVELRKEIPADQVVTKCGQIIAKLQEKNYLSSNAEMVKCDARLFTYSSVVVRIRDQDLKKFERIDTGFIKNLRYYEQPFADLGDVGLLRLQKCLSDPDLQSPGPEELAAVS